MAHQHHHVLLNNKSNIDDASATPCQGQRFHTHKRGKFQLVAQAEIMVGTILDAAGNSERLIGKFRADLLETNVMMSDDNEQGGSIMIGGGGESNTGSIITLEAPKP
jgi:hypothetical protein